VSSYKATKIYGHEQLLAFLRIVDKHLESSATIVIVGGSAAAFHSATSTTNDIDTYEAVEPDLEQAVAKAVAETGFQIAVNHASVAQVPYNHEDRLEPQLTELERLKVFVLERHDLVLSKVIRGTEHDYQQIQEVHAQG
jgi:uncharacterized nucleotidyltransferase DUF6036